MQRTTAQRRVIVEELRKLKSHPTAAELYVVVRRRLPHISLGTVYRNLDLLSRTGKVLRLTNSDTEARFDGDTSEHCHVRCEICGRVDDAEEATGLVPETYPKRIRGYEISGYRLEFLGVCPECQLGSMVKGTSYGKS